MDIIFVMGGILAFFVFLFIIRSSYWDGRIMGMPSVHVSKLQLTLFWIFFIGGIGFAYLVGYLQTH